MKPRTLALLCVTCSLLASAAFQVASDRLKDRRVVWQWDAARAEAAAEKRRQAEAARAAAALEAKRKKVEKERPGWTVDWNGNVVKNSATLVTNQDGTVWFLATNSGVFWVNGWSSYYQQVPTFRPGDIEWGYRADGMMCWRTPPELPQDTFWTRAWDKAKKGIHNVNTNWF